MGLDSESGPARVVRGVGRYVRRVDVEFPPPDEPRGDALFDDRFEEAAEDSEAVTLAQAGQVVAEIPSQAQPIGDDPQQLALGAQSLEE